jgi:hypothetical protein
MTELKQPVMLCFILMFSLSFVSKVCEGNRDLISALEKEFLSGLGLTKRPRSINKNINIPDDVIEMYFLKTGIKIQDSIFRDRREKG